MIELKPVRTYQLKVDGELVKTESGNVLVFMSKDLPLLNSLVKTQIETLHKNSCEIIEIVVHTFIKE